MKLKILRVELKIDINGRLVVTQWDLIVVLVIIVFNLIPLFDYLVNGRPLLALAVAFENNLLVLIFVSADLLSYPYREIIKEFFMNSLQSEKLYFYTVLRQREVSKVPSFS